MQWDADRLSELLDSFVEQYGGIQQRGAAWYEQMGTTVGGSELAGVMGLSSYSSFFSVVESKIAILSGNNTWTGSAPCWWGTLFEDVTAAYVALDLGAPVKGDSICVCVHAGHRNSPDGYVVARMYYAEGRLHLWTTDMGGRDSGDADEAAREEEQPLTHPRILLLEFKAPHSRKPNGRIPRHYVPQVLSGLAVSPVASLGLFVDAAFRKCPLEALGDTSEYDREYHHRDQEAEWHYPVAWGLIAVYAPTPDAPLECRRRRGASLAERDADAALAGIAIAAAVSGLRPDRTRAADLGAATKKEFDRTLSVIDWGGFRVERGAPCFADGRGGSLHSREEVAAAVESLRAAAPAAYWLMGVIPWKLMAVDYVFLERRPGFFEEVAPLIAEVHRCAAEGFAAPDRAAWLREQRRARGEKNGPRAAPVAADELQDLFDSVGPGG